MKLFLLKKMLTDRILTICHEFNKGNVSLVFSSDRSVAGRYVMWDLFILFFTDKNFFTYLIMVLFFLNSIVQAFIFRDYWWGGYWMASVLITLCALMRGGS